MPDAAFLLIAVVGVFAGLCVMLFVAVLGLSHRLHTERGRRRSAEAEASEQRFQCVEWEHIAASRTRALADKDEYIGSLERSVCDLTETVEFYRGEYELVSTISPCAPRRRRGHCRQGAQR